MTVQLIIRGKVQGVFFRASAKEKATVLNICGWVQNTREGHVEMMISGIDSSVKEFIAWCRQGPPGAIVTDVSVVEKEEMKFENFLILR